MEYNEVQSLVHAIAILNRAKFILADGPMFPFSAVDHASKYLDEHIASYFEDTI
jgi:hypothetical protein